MKAIATIIFIFSVTHVFGQSSDSLGISNSFILNRQEVYFLNAALKESRDTFDFSNKKVAFVTGSNGATILSKKDYFLRIMPWIDKGSSPQIFFVAFTAEEKQRSGGYDAIVFSWVKVFTPKQKRIIIDQLSKKTNPQQ